MLQKHINTNLNNPRRVSEQCRTMRSRVMMQQIVYCLWCVQLLLFTHMHWQPHQCGSQESTQGRWSMQNSAVNNHDATYKLLSMMCVDAHCSLACTDNPINAYLNNPCGIGKRCGIIWSTVMIQQTGCCLWCLQLHIVHSHAPTIALMQI